MSDALVQAFVGAQGGVLAIWCTIPIEKVQQKLSAPEAKGVGVFELIARVQREEGVRGFWRGVDVLTCMQILEKTIMYFLLTGLRARYRIGTPGAPPPSLAQVTWVAYLADLGSRPVTYPLEAVASRMMTRNLSARAAIAQVLDAGGPLSIYRGVEYYLFLALRQGLTQGIFDRIKLGLLKVPAAATLPFTTAALVSAFSSSIARVIVYPVFRAFIVSKSGSGAGKVNAEGTRPGPLGVMAALFRDGGFTGMFQGLLPELFRGVCFQTILLTWVEMNTGWQRRLLTGKA